MLVRSVGNKTVVLVMVARRDSSDLYFTCGRTEMNRWIGVTANATASELHH
jgi:hypothetical protein